MAPFNSYVQMLFFVQALLAVLAVAIARYIQGSWIGRGLQALKDDELAAGCTRVPTLRPQGLACVVPAPPSWPAGGPPAPLPRKSRPPPPLQTQLFLPR